MLKKSSKIIGFLFILVILCTGCVYPNDPEESMRTDSGEIAWDPVEPQDWFDSIPEYRGTPYIEVNHDIPFFTDEEKRETRAFELYSDLDTMERCGTAYANVCEELMPTEERENSLSSVTPAGWCQTKYDEEWLYNRCHLIAFQLAGENDNEKNLITGTRYFNVNGMLPFENTVADYIDDNRSNHVLYRVTPIYEDDSDLVACGVLMEAWSVEDNGYGCQFCVFVYNVQPGISIDYATGESSRAKGNVRGSKASDSDEDNTYVLNTNSRKYHTQDCPNGKRISDRNRETYVGSADELISQGYDPAECCNP